LIPWHDGFYAEQLSEICGAQFFAGNVTKVLDFLEYFPSIILRLRMAVPAKEFEYDASRTKQ